MSRLISKLSLIRSLKLSTIGTPTYKLSKLFLPLLPSLTLNEYTTKDSFPFAEELSNYDSNLVMATFDDVESLFTNIPLQETIDLCAELLFKGNAQLLFLFNPQKSSVDVFLIKILKNTVTKKVIIVCFFSLGEENF